jgi:hypothetical protein
VDANFALQVEYVEWFANRFNFNLAAFPWDAWVCLGSLGLGMYAGQERRSFVFALWERVRSAEAMGFLNGCAEKYGDGITRKGYCDCKVLLLGDSRSVRRQGEVE